MTKHVVTPQQILGIPPRTNLNKFVSLPSAIHGYSLAIEYMRDWILKSFPKEFFKTVHVNGKHVLADYKKFNQQIRKEVIKPALAIIPSVNVDYDSERVDQIQAGLNIYGRRSNLADPRFFKDIDNNLFIAIQFKQLEMPFTFRMRVRTRAQQMDLMEYTRLNCRLGSTQTHFIDMDCHVPNDIMMSLAIDAGFPVEEVDGQFRVKNVYAFLRYLNANSQIPFMYKLRAINGKQEYFIRVSNVYTHISCLDSISVDDGERQGSMDANFHVEFQAVLHFCVPAIYAYMSMHEHRIMNKELGDITAMYQIVSLKPPEKNEKGWNQLLETQWIDDSKHIEDIHFEELLEDEDLMKVIKHTVAIGLSPSMFLDVKIYNGQRELHCNLDWESFRIIVGSDVVSDVSDITIYADMMYVNDIIANIDNMKDSRIKLGDKEVH